MFGNSNTQQHLNSDYRSTLDHHQLNDDEESNPIGQNSSLSHFIPSSSKIDEDEEDEPLVSRQQNSQNQSTTNKSETNVHSSDESEQQHQERLSDTDEDDEEASEDDNDDDEDEEEDEEDNDEDDDEDDDDDDDDFDDKIKSRTRSKRGFGQAKTKLTSKKQAKRLKSATNNASSTSTHKRQRTSSSTSHVSVRKKVRRQQSSGSGNSSTSVNKRKIRRTAASNPINYHEESDDNDPSRRKTKKQQRHSSSNSDSDDDQNTNNDDESNSNEYHQQTITDLESNTAKRQTKVRTSDNLSSSGEGATLQTDEPSSEIIEKVLKVRFGRRDATGPSTTIYNIEEFGDPNANYNGDDETRADGEEQFLIKWKNWSHLHNTWENRLSLQQAHVKSSRILENFLKQHEQTRSWRRENGNMDEIELFECQQELNDTALAGYQSVERIVAHEKNREQDNIYDYLCKWDGLQYSDCTWEDGTLIAKRFQEKIDEYNARLTQQNDDLQLQQQQQQTNSGSGRKKTAIIRPRFVPMTVQPLYLAPEEPEFKLRDYQLEGLNWLAHSWCKQNSVILADEMGLGKTIQTIAFLSYVFEEHNCHGPFLIAVPLSTIQGWQQEFKRWAPYMNTVVYIGDMVSREKIRHFEMYSSGNKKLLKFHALLTTYDFLLKDSKYLSTINWNCILIDEAHRLKNDDSMLYRTLIQFESQSRILITGTPLQNSLKELWSLLHFIMPNYFNDWDNFDSKYSSLLTTNDTSLVRRSGELHKELEPFLLRRIKRDVEKSLPAKVEQILRVEMTRLQKQYYKWILTRNYRALTNERGGNLPSFINIMMELKKCANHAFFVKRDDENNTTLDEIIKGSGKLLLLDKLLLKLRASNHRILIFSQMVKMLNILAEYCKLRRFPFQRLDGSMKGEIRRQALNSFNREGSEDFIFLLSTRAGGLGINLATADTVIIYDSDWNPQNDLQAQARAHRIGQTKQVNIYRLVAKQSVEETIIERAKQKMVLDHLVIQRMDTTGRNAFQNINNTSTPASTTTTDNRSLTKEELNTIIKFGAEDLFKENSLNEEGSVEEESQRIDIDEILRRAETRQDDDSLLRNSSEDLLSQFKIANIQTMEDDIIEPTTIVNKNKSWKDIIPESERQKFDDECLAELTAPLPPRNRKRVELFNSTSDLDNNNNTNRSHLDSILKEFTANEIRRFVKSFKKFADPIHRLDLITIDAELEDKSRQDIDELAKHIYNQCLMAVEQHATDLSPTTNTQSSLSPKDEQNSSTYPREKIPTIRLHNVSINAVQILNSIRDLEALKKVFLSNNNEQRKTFSFPSSIKIKPVHWSCSWTLEDDKALLRGIYEYGYSNWEQIKMEPELSLSSKILLDDKQLKPQANHLQTRADYLLRLLKQYYENPSNKKKDATKKKSSGTHLPSKKMKITTEDNVNGPNSAKRQRRTNGPVVSNHEKHPKSKEMIDNSSGDDEITTNKSIKKKSNEEKGSKPVKKEEENSSNDMFKQCKELLRPVKKWFSSLDVPEDAYHSHDDYNKAFEKCLLKIGDQIETVLKSKTDDDYQTYRHHLWTFVSKFTTKLTDSQLRKNYRTFVKKRNEENLTSSQTQKSSQYQQPPNPSSQSNTKNRQTEQDETYRKAGWGSSAQPNNTITNTNRPTKDSRLKHASTMPLSKASRAEQSNSTIGSTNTGTTSDYDTHHHSHQFDRNRHQTSGNNNRRPYHESTGDSSSSDYRSSYHRDRDRDRDNNSSRGPRRYDSMPSSRYDQPSQNNRQSFQSNFSQPPPPYDESRSSNRSGGNNNRSSQNASSQPPPPPPPSNIPPPPPPPLSGPELFQSMYLQYYDMFMQQATGLSSSQSSTSNSISPNSYADMAAAYARQQMQQPPAPQS